MNTSEAKCYIDGIVTGMFLSRGEFKPIMKDDTFLQKERSERVCSRLVNEMYVSNYLYEERLKAFSYCLELFDKK